jgi:hopene-associated glycosyltransferase HpnB
MFLGLLALCIWVYLFAAHGRFWASSPELSPATPAELPSVDIVVPARDEAGTIAPVIASLLAQDYAGRFQVVLVDDNSTDATVANAGSSPRLRVIRLTSKPPGWSGKLWALEQGVADCNAPLILLTDADIVHDPRHLSALVAHLTASQLSMVSEMVRLNCKSLAERALIPAFVYFFQMLYPFQQVNDARSRVAAAAGGTVLIRRDSLDDIGGIAAIRHALIDDVTLARAVKRVGGIYLGHSGLARSIRPYPRFVDLWDMIARTAFTQLRYSPWWLMATVAGLSLVWWVPPLEALFGRDVGRIFGASAYVLAAITFLPTLRRYQRSPWWSLALPLIALFYMGATVGSAVNHWRGKGAHWKSRAYEKG